MLLAAPVEGASVSVLVCFDGENGCEDLWLSIGRTYSDHASEIQPGPEGNPSGVGRIWHPETKPDPGSCRKSRIAVFNVPGDAITDGRNKLVVRSENVSTTILGIDVCVGTV